MAGSVQDIILEIMEIYGRLDGQIAGFSQSAAIRCRTGCGSCCESPEIHSTLLECLPLAAEVYRTTKEESVLSLLEEASSRGDSRCIFYIADTEHPGNGRCGIYSVRPLVCRMFGVAGTKDKRGEVRISLCHQIRERDPEALERTGRALREGAEIPIFHPTFMKIASLEPGNGYRTLPINQAFREALGYLYWHRPPLDSPDSVAF